MSRKRTFCGIEIIKCCPPSRIFFEYDYGFTNRRLYCKDCHSSVRLPNNSNEGLEVLSSAWNTLMELKGGSMAVEHDECEYNCGATDCEAPDKTARAQAQKGIEAEAFRAAVEWEKIKIRTKKSFFKKIFPWKITIQRV
jgi:hypothetical protein